MRRSDCAAVTRRAIGFTAFLLVFTAFRPFSLRLRGGTTRTTEPMRATETRFANRNQRRRDVEMTFERPSPRPDPTVENPVLKLGKVQERPRSNRSRRPWKTDADSGHKQATSELLVNKPPKRNPVRSTDVFVSFRFDPVLPGFPVCLFFFLFAVPALRTAQVFLVALAFNKVYLGVRFCT